MNIRKLFNRKNIGEMFAISFPMMVSEACETFIVFIMRLFVARLGPEQMNAVMLGGLSAFVLATFFTGIVGYSNALVAQYFGAKKKEKCGTVVGCACIVSLIGYPVILALAPLVTLYFETSGISARQLLFQKEFFSLLVYGSIFSLLRISLSGFYSGIGRTRVVMFSTVCATLVSLATAYPLVFGAGLGVKGAALATIIGNASGFLVLLAAYMRYKRHPEFKIRGLFSFDKKIFRTLLKFGYPMGISYLSNMVAFNLVVMMFHRHGSVTATAATILFNWDMVSFVPLMGLEVGVASLVGRAMGAGKPDAAHEATLSGLAIGWVYSGSVMLVFSFLPAYLVDFFKPAQASEIFTRAHDLAVFMIRLAAVYVLVDTLFAICSGALRGAGDTFWAMIISGVAHWTLVPVLYLVLHVMHLSARIGWICSVCVFFSFGTLMYLRYRSGKWRSIRVIEHEEPLADYGVSR